MNIAFFQGAFFFTSSGRGSAWPIWSLCGRCSPAWEEGFSPGGGRAHSRHSSQGFRIGTNPLANLHEALSSLPGRQSQYTSCSISSTAWKPWGPLSRRCRSHDGPGRALSQRNRSGRTGPQQLLAPHPCHLGHYRQCPVRLGFAARSCTCFRSGKLNQKGSRFLPAASGLKNSGRFELSLPDLGVSLF